MKDYTVAILVLFSAILGLLCYIVSDVQGVGRYRVAAAGLAVLASSRPLEFPIANSVQWCGRPPGLPRSQHATITWYLHRELGKRRSRVSSLFAIC